MMSQRDLSAAERHFRQQLLKTSGTLSNWATWEGNHFWASSDNQVSLAFRRVGRVALVVTEPLGSFDERGLAEFMKFCRSEKLTPSFYCADTDTKERLRNEGWKHLEIGQEALLTPRDFGATAKVSRVIRHVNSRAQRGQVSPLWTSWSELDVQSRQEVQMLLAEANHGRRMPALGFTIGNGRELDKPDVALMLAVAKNNEILGLTSWLPVYRNGLIVGRTLESIARKRHSFSGIVDFMISSAMQRFITDHLEIASLSGVPLAKHHGAHIEQRTRGDFLLKSLGRILEPIYGVRGLLRFKHKFNPSYRDLYLVFPRTLDLPKIMVAVAIAYFFQSN